MRVWTECEIDIESGKVSRGTSFTYYGPVALCNRSLVNDSEQGIKTANKTAGDYGAAAGQIQADLVPRLEKQAVNPQGFGTFGLGEMETGAEESAAGASGKAKEAMSLNALRSGNAAGLGADQVGAAGETARAGGSAWQSIMSKNAQLKASQQEQANQLESGVLGENIKGQLSAEGLVPEDVKAGADANSTGWVQDLTGGLDAGANLIKALKYKGGGDN